MAAAGTAGGACAPSTGDIGRSLTGLTPRGLRARLASAARFVVSVRCGFWRSASASSEYCRVGAVRYADVDEPLASFKAELTSGALFVVTGAGRSLDTRNVPEDEGPDEVSLATLTDSEFAVSSLIVLAARRTVPDLAALEGARGGGISSASLAAFWDSATRGRVEDTSLCEISFKPRIDAFARTGSTGGLAARGPLKSLTVEM